MGNHHVEWDDSLWPRSIAMLVINRGKFIQVNHGSNWHLQGIVEPKLVSGIHPGVPL
jgi:hypothetical protein